MAFTYSAWMPCKASHDLKETRRFLAAAAKGKPVAFKSYSHVKGKVSSTMDAGALDDLRTEVVALSRTPICAAMAFPEDVTRLLLDLLSTEGVRLSQAEARQRGTLDCRTARYIAPALPALPVETVEPEMAMAAECAEESHAEVAYLPLPPLPLPTERIESSGMVLTTTADFPMQAVWVSP